MTFIIPTPPTTKEMATIASSKKVSALMIVPQTSIISPMVVTRKSSLPVSAQLSRASSEGAISCLSLNKILICSAVLAAKETSPVLLSM